MEKKEIDFGKRFGMGGLRFPLIDPDDQMSIDYDTLNVMIDKFMAAGYRYFDTSYIYHGELSESALGRYSLTGIPGIPSCFPRKCPSNS